jgi:hypothetical protein
MLTATAIAIFIIPVLFVLMERLAGWWHRQPYGSHSPATSEGRA